MIMPCMNCTSARDGGSSVPFVEAGSVLLGFPGAPGCTTTGAVAESVCCARPAAEKPVGALTASSTPSRSTLLYADRSRRKPQTLKVGVSPDMVETVNVPRTGKTEKCGAQQSPNNS